MNWRIFSLNLAPVVAEFCRMATSGALRAAIWELLMKSAVIIFLSRPAHALAGTCTNVQIANAIFIAYGG
jgi:hypothetical protein